MRLGERARDWAITGGFLLVIGTLVVVGWLTRENRVRMVVGEPVPELTLPRINGDTARLADYRGRVLLVNLWATWCAPCIREMPSLQRAYEEYRDDGLEILAVALDENPGERAEDGTINGIVSRFVDDLGLTFPVAVDPAGRAERVLGTSYLPTTVLVDRQGRIRGREVGGHYWDQEPYVDMIETLLRED